MTRLLTAKSLSLLALVAACAAWAFTLRPQSLGGPAGYVMVRGTSMLHTYQPGDLVITRPQRAYRKGDIVAYHVPKGEVGQGITVIHRIVGGSARRGYVIQGDNNRQPDDWRPHRGDVVGKAWLSLPRSGRVFLFLRAPIPLASLAAGIAMAIVLVPANEKQPREEDPECAGTGTAGEDGQKRKRRRWRIPLRRG